MLISQFCIRATCFCQSINQSNSNCTEPHITSKSDSHQQNVIITFTKRKLFFSWLVYLSIVNKITQEVLKVLEGEGLEQGTID